MHAGGVSLPERILLHPRHNSGSGWHFWDERRALDTCADFQGPSVVGCTVRGMGVPPSGLVLCFDTSDF